MSCFFHNGVDVIEQMENKNPVYYWRYTTDGKDAQGRYHNYTTVLNEASDSLYAFEVSYHGARTFENNGITKIVGEFIVEDTIHNPNNWEEWGTMQVLTSSIYDLKTGEIECTFPKGTTFTQVAVVNDVARIYTQNDNMSMFLNRYHPMGSESTCMKTLVFNMDYSLYKELDYSFASTGLVKNDINYATLYQPLYDGKNIYFLHSFSSYVKDNEGGILGYSYRNLLVDENGALVKVKDNPTATPYTALRLPSTNQTVFLSYNGTMLSCPELDSIGSFSDYTVKEDGSIVFARVMKDSVRLLNDKLKVIGSFPALSEEWSLSDFSQRNVADDDLLELVFRNFNNGVKVLNENGQLLVNEPDSTWRLSFMEYSPVFLMEDGHKYANLVDENLSLWYRTAPLTAEVSQDKTLLPLSLQVYRQINDSIFRIDSVNGTGIYEGMLPEGTYFIRTLSDSLPSTYYPSALLWEDATPIAFTTDSIPVLTINQPANPQPRPLANDGSIIGSLTCDQPELLWAIEQNQQVRVYAVISGSNIVLAVDSLSNMTFELNHLTWGSYDVLMDIPGKPMLNIATIMIYPTHKQEVMEFSLGENGISVEVVTGLTKQTANKGFAIVPNPATDFIQFDAAFEGCSIELFDMTGRGVLSTTIQGRQVRVKQLPEGLYLVRVQSKEGVVHSTLKKK